MDIVQVDLNKDFNYALDAAVAALLTHGAIVYPTDTLYGLGANALEEKAVQKIFDIKHRPLAKPLPILVKNLLWARELAYISAHNEEILQKIWPGKITVVLPKRNIIPNITTAGSNSIAMRIADHPFTDRLLGRFGYPITSTSANISGDEPTLDIHAIIATLRHTFPQPHLIIDVGILPPSEASTILDLTTDKPKILRVGPSKPKELLKLLQI